MSAEYTPGPWKIGTPPPNGEQTIGTQQGLMVAVATTGANTPTEANARLIAAAPELFEALQLAVRQNSHDMLMTGEELRKCEAAIAQATGGQA
jgi:hypothetical protein